MRLATIVFRVAAVWGMLLLIPMYFMFASSSGSSPAPLTFPQTYFGFLGVALAWQLAFWVIGSDPRRFRPLMIPAVVEKFSYVVAIAVLYLKGFVGVPELSSIVPDGILGILFVVSYLRTAPSAAGPT